MNRINPVVMQMFHEGCQRSRGRIYSHPDARDKQFHKMENNAEEKAEPGSLCSQKFCSASFAATKDRETFILVS